MGPQRVGHDWVTFTSISSSTLKHTGLERWTAERRTEDTTASFEPSTSNFQKREWISFGVPKNNIHQRWKLQRWRFLLNRRNGVLPLEMFSPKNWAAFLHNGICTIWVASRGCISFVGDAHRPLEGQDGLCLGTQAPKQQLSSSSMHTNHRRTWGTPRYLPPHPSLPKIQIQLVGCGDQDSAFLRSSWVMLMKPS